MCIPGDNRVNVLGLYSVQMRRKRQTHCERQEQHFHHSPWESGRVERGGESRGGGDILATALKTDKTYRVLSMYSVHRINPQCVLTNITQLPPDWFVSVGEARSAPWSTPTPPLQSPPTGTETAAPTGRRSVVRGGYTFACNKKQRKTLYRWIWGDSGESVQPGIWCWAVRRGWAERRVSFHIQSS